MNHISAQQLSIADAWRFETATFFDKRGSFFECYKEPAVRDALGYGVNFVQANCSVSRRGSLRGISVVDVPPGQAKYVTCLSGAVLDVVVDLRVGSPAFGSWHMERLDEEGHTSIYVPAGLGHCFLSLAESSTLLYLLSTVHDPHRERRVHPLDPDIGITWPAGAMTLSTKDASAPGLREAERAGILPRYDACRPTD